MKFNTIFDEARKGSDNACSRELLFESVLSTAGFSGFFLWDLSGAFMFASPFAAYLTVNSMLFARILFLAALIGVLVFAALRSDLVYEHRVKMLGGGIALALVPLALMIMNTVLQGALPIALVIVAFISFGIAHGALLLYWTIYFSRTSTRYTPAAIALSSIFGTVLFVVISNMQSTLLGLFVVTFAVACSTMSLFALMHGLPEAKNGRAEEYTSLSYFTVKSAVSVGAHGMAFGFTSTTLFKLGLEATIIGCASGILGAVICLLQRRADLDISFLQRVTFPPVIIGLLLFPFGNGVWQLACCCLINVSLSHFVIVGWIRTITSSSEFSLQPVYAISLSKLPGWIGFTAGAAAAWLICFAFDLSGWQLMAAMVAMASVIVLAMTFYGLDDSEINKRLSDLAIEQSEGVLVVEEEDDGGEKRKRQFDEMVDRYGLSPRESEVFQLLAKGRNAEYIGKKLVISNFTARSHIYHIYQKMGINSQQSLIDEVEKHMR